MLSNRRNKALRVLGLSGLLLLAACGPQKPPYQGIKIGAPYTVSGVTYTPHYDPHYDEIGDASWYGPGFDGGKTASGEQYDQEDMTAAHKTLPLPSIVRVTNLDNGRSAIVKVNDRGPFVGDRIIDLSHAAAEKLGVVRTGIARVRVQFLDPETREYVMTLPKGSESLHKLDMLAAQDAAKQRVAAQPLVAEEQIAQADVEENDAGSFAPISAPTKPDIFALADENAHLPAGESVQERPLAPPSTVAMAVAAPASVATGSGHYFVQAGTFAVWQNAQHLKDRLSAWSQARIQDTASQGKTLYRVLAGPFVSREQAQHALEQFGVAGARILQE